MAIVTWDTVNKGTGVVLSNGNLTAAVPNANNTVRASEGKTSGKRYWEVSFTSLVSGFVGIVSSTASLTGIIYSSNLTRWYVNANGNRYPENTSYGASYSVSDTIGIALDLDIGTLEFYKNGVSQGISHTNIKVLGEVFPAVTSGSSTAGSTSTVNFGATPFKYDIPNGYHSYDWRGYADKILLLTEKNNVETVDTTSDAMVQLSGQSEQSFINHGMSQSDLASIDPTADFTEKHYIQDASTPLGEGKVFEQVLDIDKIIKKIRIN